MEIVMTILLLIFFFGFLGYLTYDIMKYDSEKNL
jgi:hypothetical protein